MFNYHTSRSTATLTKDCKVIQLMLVSPNHFDSFYKYVKVWPYKQDIIVHFDYYRTPTRFLFMSKARQKVLVDQICKLNALPNVIGCLLHTDSLFSAKSYDILQKQAPLFNPTALRSSYESALWKGSQPWLKMEEIYQKYKDNETDAFIRRCESESVLAFLQTLDSEGCTGTVFFENTCRSLRGMSLFGTKPAMEWVCSARTKSFKLRMCLDIEHAYASGWDVDFDSVVGTHFLGAIHLNAIPHEVESGSYKDRHSQNTLCESKYSFDYYEKLKTYCEENGIPYVRELDVDALIRELQQLHVLNYIPYHKS